MALYGYSAIDTSDGTVFSVSVDLSNPEEIVWPFEVAIVGRMGEKGLRIGPKMGAGWRGKVGGEATYRFYVPEDGKYHIWAYVLWFDKCTNAVFAKIDTLDRAIIGNDPIFKQWHWVRGFSVNLTKGAHALKLSNHSDHIALEKLLFMNSATAVPDDCDLVFSDIFYDGFDGCHIGNFTSWRAIGGKWSVKHPSKSTCFVENAVVGESNGLSLFTYEGSDWSDYSLSVAVKSAPSSDHEAMTGICFGLQGEDEYYQLKWRQTANEDVALMELSEKGPRGVRILTSSEVQLRMTEWNLIEVCIADRTIKAKIADEPVIEVPADHKISGGIGLLLQGDAAAYFDEIHVRTTSDGLNP